MNEIVGGHRLKIESFLLGGVRGMQIWSWQHDAESSSSPLLLPSPTSSHASHTSHTSHTSRRASSSSSKADQDDTNDTNNNDNEDEDKQPNQKFLLLQRLVSLDVSHPAILPDHSPS
ncbi:hypothetical protein OFC46_25605, partial [Escherichia coli]|nr:hypothetical protein [Escherichia coli]